MKIEDLKVGLYFTLPEENFKEVRKLGNDYDIGNLFKSRYKYYTPVKIDGKWYMVNTSQIVQFAKETLDNVDYYIDLMKENQKLNNIELYPCKIEELNQELLDLFEFSFDLAQYKILSKYDVGDYKKEYLINLQLYWGHNNSRGIFLVQEETEPDVECQQVNILRSLYPPKVDWDSYKEALKKFEHLEVKNEEIFKEVKMYINKIKQFDSELEEMTRDFKWIDSDLNIKEGKINEI